MFTLISFKINHKNNTLYNCRFADKTKNNRTRPLSTIIIGENGSGKSYLLSQVSDFFRFIQKTSIGEKKYTYKYDYVDLEYFIDDDSFLIRKEKNKITTFKNNEECLIQQIRLPIKTIAMSFMVNDKFSFSRPNDDTFYDYLGVRATSNASYTSTIKRMIVNALVESLSKNDKIELIIDVLKFLKMNKRISITYDLVRKTLFNRAMEPSIIRQKAASIIDRKRYINESEFNEIIRNPRIILNDISILRKNIRVIKEKIFLTIDLKGIDYTNKAHLVKSLSRLEQMEYISLPDIQFYKDSGFSFEETSSGEKNLIFTFLNLIAHIEKNSLVLIDEPEISLHPSWQMKYINFIKKSISAYYSSHLILASHSHFMISDLEPDSSSLVSIHQNHDQRKCNYIEHSTFAWSVENILYSVFHLRTTRNAQVEMDLIELSTLISTKSEDINRVIEITNKLGNIVLDRNDPLTIIISQANKYISDRTND
ncbi:hypothetical protein DT144_08035 [Salmonella enterica subsp. enterica]|nr:hypothetical protein [Salmonella enterica subsp. enterica]EDH9166020.1 hypothetical protein [Salmonella enterica subsp. enterica serovar Fallowfield]